MSDMAKKARAAMKAKAGKLTSADPHQKVDSSTWSPPEALNTEAKTGMRPVSRRQFKSGGKVAGEKAKAMMGKKPRASGGSAMPPVDRLINRDMKKANDLRDGVKHVGGMKSGGRAEKCGGGSMKRGKYATEGFVKKGINRLRDAVGLDSPDYEPKFTDKSTYNEPTQEERDSLAEMARKASDTRSNQEAQRKSGGRSKKYIGGPLAGAQKQMDLAAQTAGVPGDRMKFQRTTPGKLAGYAGLRKEGGRTPKHDDIAADKALVKKMVKPSALKRKDGGKVFSGPSYPGKVPGVTGGRIARKSGGSAKSSKTHINIIMPQKDTGMMPQGGPIAPPPGAMPGGPMGGGRPIPVTPAAGAPAAMPMPMPMPIPMPAAGGAPAPRKNGGRLSKKARSYKDMEAGAGSGEGRLQKTDIAKHAH